MPIFTDETFRFFLGSPQIYEHDWGIEWRFAVSKEILKDYSNILCETLYYHHSFFDLHDEIAELGFPLSAQSLRNRYSGNPFDHKTQMGNLGEVIAAHLSRTYLRFQGTPIYPKRYNTNVDQSMKGIDVLNFRDINSPEEILIGEVKTVCRQNIWDRLGGWLRCGFPVCKIILRTVAGSATAFAAGFVS